MISKEFFAALDELEKDKSIEKSIFIDALEAGLVSAFKRETGEARHVSVSLNEVRNEIKVNAYKIIVEEVVDNDKEISLEEAHEIKKAYELGDKVSDDVTPNKLSRIAIQTAKQVIMQRLNDLRKERLVSEMSEKEGEIANAKIVGIDGDTVKLEIANIDMAAIMSGQDRVNSDRYIIGRTIKVYVKNTRSSGRNPQVMVSRSAPGLVKRLFESEVPEIKSGEVVIKGIVRDAGNRTKMSVYSENTNLDAVGACIGQRGVRINAVVNELNGEKVDLIPWSADPLEYIACALSPAKVRMVQVEEEGRSAKVMVDEDKLSLAIGKGGQNVRLAAKLTGWKIDVKAMTSANELQESDALEELDNELEITDVQAEVAVAQTEE